MDEWQRKAAELPGMLLWTVRRALGFLQRKAPHLGGALAAILFFASAWLYFGVHQPSSFFPRDTIVSIPEGSTVRDVAALLRAEHVVRSTLALQLAISLDGRPVLAGDYYFDEPQTLTVVASRLVRGQYDLSPVKVRIPEGATTYRMAEVLADALPRFDPGVFMMQAADKEGYLYPDTYHFMPTVTAPEVIAQLEATFYERLREIESELAAFGRPIHELVTMASLLEKEAYRDEDRHIIAGILWHRLEIGMPLQVDAVFGYIARTDTFSPKFSDLEVESPYNTYKHVGLPPGPIGSPSISSLRAAAQPATTTDLFYLHGRDGGLYTARTYDGHLLNRARYLD